jgi:cytochrome c553
MNALRSFCSPASDCRVNAAGVYRRRPASPLLFWLLGGLLAVLPVWTSAQVSVQVPALAVDALNKQVHVRFGQTNVLVRFALTNVSTQPLVIKDVTLSCGCSAASLPARPWTLRPGEHGEVLITTDLRGKQGSLLKSAVVHTTAGMQALSYQVDIQEPVTPEERARNQRLAKSDRQAVFRGACAECHATPTRQKLGGELFAAACGICHEAEHRAKMVPDLRALKQPVRRDYWLETITHGKPGTLMPAFAAAEGGPLSDAQIRSLADFLATR